VAISRSLPVPADVRDLFEGLLGRSSTVAPAPRVQAAGLRDTLVSLYVDDALKLAAVVGMDLPLAVNAGAALGLIPVGGAQACIAERNITAVIAENVTEVCNVLSSLLNKEGTPRIRMYQTYLPGQRPPVDALGLLLAPGRRLDLTVDLAGYGSGKFSLALAS
jgi:hypothetical protein